MATHGKRPLVDEPSDEELEVEDISSSEDDQPSPKRPRGEETPSGQNPDTPAPNSSNAPTRSSPDPEVRPTPSTEGLKRTSKLACQEAIIKLLRARFVPTPASGQEETPFPLASVPPSNLPTKAIDSPAPSPSAQQDKGITSPSSSPPQLSGPIQNTINPQPNSSSSSSSSSTPVNAGTTSNTVNPDSDPSDWANAFPKSTNSPTTTNTSTVPRPSIPTAPPCTIIKNDLDSLGRLKTLADPSKKDKRSYEETVQLIIEEIVKQKEVSASLQSKVSDSELALVQKLAAEASGISLGEEDVPETKHVIVARNIRESLKDIKHSFNLFPSFDQDNTVINTKDALVIIAFDQPMDQEDAGEVVTSIFPHWEILPIETLFDTDCVPNSQHVAYINSPVIEEKDIQEISPVPIRRITINNSNIMIFFFSEADLNTFIMMQSISKDGIAALIERSYIGLKKIKLILRKIPANVKVRMIKSWLKTANVRFEEVDFVSDDTRGSKGFVMVTFKTEIDRFDAGNKTVLTKDGKRLEWRMPDEPSSTRRGCHGDRNN